MNDADSSPSVTFPAREFVLGIEWRSKRFVKHDPDRGFFLTDTFRSPPSPSSSPATHLKPTKVGFCVPEDEDESSEDCSREPSVQIVEVGRQTFSVPDPPSSDDFSDSDTDSVKDLPTAGNSSTSTTPDHLVEPGGEERVTYTTHTKEDTLSNHKTLKIACLLTNDGDQAERGAGTSSFNPIELDDEIARLRESAMVEIEDNRPELLPSKPAMFTDKQAEVAPTQALSHLHQPQPLLHTEHKTDEGEDTGHDVIPESDTDDFRNNLFDEVDEDELYQLTEPYVDGQQPYTDIQGVRVHKMVKFLEPDYHSEDSEDDENEDEDEDEDDCLTFFNSDYEERQAFLAEGTTNNSTTESSSQSSLQLGTEQIDQVPLVMVEDSQLHGQMPTRISTAGLINVGTVPELTNIDYRAPSPSDAALAKKPSFPRIRLSSGENIMRPCAAAQMSIPQSVYDKGHLAGPQAPSEFQLPRDLFDNSAVVQRLTRCQDYRGQESIFDDADHFPRYKVGPFSSRPATCSTLPSLMAACEQSRSNDLRMQQHLRSAASRAKACSTSSKDFVSVRGADSITEQRNKSQRPVGPSPALSIKDLVDDNHNEVSSSSRGLKRKAAEITQIYETIASPEKASTQQTILTQASLTTSQESILHDAQPRNTQASSPQNTILQFYDSIPEKPEPSTVGTDEEPMRKKIKTAANRPGRFGAFISGFVVGGLSLAGAFAAIVATVPNSVREEAWREFGYTG